MGVRSAGMRSLKSLDLPVEGEKTPHFLSLGGRFVASALRPDLGGAIGRNVKNYYESTKDVNVMPQNYIAIGRRVVG